MDKTASNKPGITRLCPSDLVLVVPVAKPSYKLPEGSSDGLVVRGVVMIRKTATLRSGARDGTALDVAVTVVVLSQVINLADLRGKDTSSAVKAEPL